MDALVVVVAFLVSAAAVAWGIITQQRGKTSQPDPKNPYASYELPSHRDILRFEQIVPLVNEGKVVISGLPAGTYIARIADTNSEDPFIDAEHNVILAPFVSYPPFRREDVQVGDLAVYKMPEKSPTILHRIAEEGEDAQGKWYRFKGDNPKITRTDPYLVRPENLLYLVVGVIY